MSRQRSLETIYARSILILTCGIAIAAMSPLSVAAAGDEAYFNTHKVVLDSEGKIIPWYTPAEKAYDQFLRARWDFIKTKVPNCPGPAPRSSYPQYYFYCAFRDKNGQLVPDTWMNDVAEKIPNWFEAARLYYAYTGDKSVMDIMTRFMDYTIAHGTSPSTYAWPNFPFTTTNAGDLDFHGFTTAKRFVLNEVQVGYAGDMGLAYYRMYLYSGDKKYLTAALNAADVLARNARPGDGAKSVLPDRVVVDTGNITAEYGTHLTQTYILFDQLVKAHLRDASVYASARSKIQDFLVHYPLKTGYWTDGHTDNAVLSNTHKSNTAASDFTLALFDYPDLDPEWAKDVPKLIQWTEDNFVQRCAKDEPATKWGANIVGEQDGFLHKMDYQTARYAAECARWYAVSGDTAYREKAYRALNWVTYTNRSDGEAVESPVSEGKDISNWWSDCYGECPRMFYAAFAGVPDWAGPRENHILYSRAVLKDVAYQPKSISYTATESGGIDYLRLTFRPGGVTANRVALPLARSLTSAGYTVAPLPHGDYELRIRRDVAGEVVIR